MDAKRISHDILIRLDGEVIKRKKILSKKIYGTSHTISLAEAEFIYQEGAHGLLIGAGQFGWVRLSPKAAAFFQEKGCPITILPTPRRSKPGMKALRRQSGYFTSPVNPAFPLDEKYSLLYFHLTTGNIYGTGK